MALIVLIVDNAYSSLTSPPTESDWITDDQSKNTTIVDEKYLTRKPLRYNAWCKNTSLWLFNQHISCINVLADVKVICFSGNRYKIKRRAWVKLHTRKKVKEETMQQYPHNDFNKWLKWDIDKTLVYSNIREMKNKANKHFTHRIPASFIAYLSRIKIR